MRWGQSRQIEGVFREGYRKFIPGGLHDKTSPHRRDCGLAPLSCRRPPPSSGKPDPPGGEFRARLRGSKPDRSGQVCEDEEKHRFAIPRSHAVRPTSPRANSPSSVEFDPVFAVPHEIPDSGMVRHARENANPRSPLGFDPRSPLGFDPRESVNREQAEFLKISIKLDKLTGFFDKKLKS